MARPPAQTILARRLLFFFAALMALAAMAPVRYTMWLNDVRTVPTMLLAPLSRNLRLVTSWARPAHADIAGLTPEEISALQERAAQQETRILQLQAEVERSKDLLVELGALSGLGSPDIKHVLARVIGTTSRASAGTIEIQAGSREGVTRDSIAVARGQQLVGRITNVGPRVSTVLPITAAKSEKIPAVVMLPDGSAAPCILEAQANGTLRGPILDPDPRPGVASRPLPEVGQLVRFNHVNSNWPRSANRLVIGEVAAIEPSLKSPMRKDVIVRPRVEDLARVPEVIVRVETAPREGAEGKP